MLYKLRLVDDCYEVKVYTDALYSIVIPYVWEHDIYYVSDEMDLSEEDVLYLRLLLPPEVELVRSEMELPC